MGSFQTKPSEFSDVSGRPGPAAIYRQRAARSRWTGTSVAQTFVARVSPGDGTAQDVSEVSEVARIRVYGGAAEGPVRVATRGNRKRDESFAEVDERMHYEWSESCRPSTALIEAIADATDRDPLDMPPLYEYVDVDALDALPTARWNGTSGTVDVSFADGGVEIRLDSDGDIELQPDVTDLGQSTAIGPS